MTFGPDPAGAVARPLGIGERTEALADAASSPQRAEEIRGAVRRLVHPGHRGVLFKALAIRRSSAADAARLRGAGPMEASRCGNSTWTDI
jgi:hypothetical protein